MMVRIKERDSSVIVEYLLIASLLELCTKRLPLPWFSTLVLIQLCLLMKLFPDYMVRAKLSPKKIEKYKKQNIPENLISFYLQGIMLYQIFFSLSILGYILWNRQNGVSQIISKKYLWFQYLFFFLYQWGLRFVIWIRKKHLSV